MYDKIVECVPNFSEGKNQAIIGKIIAPFQNRPGVKLLDHSSDVNHNRTVVTVIGEPQAVRTAVIEAIGAAIAAIDLNHHHGEHPRLGAVDVVPFIPIKGMTMEEAVLLARETAEITAKKYDLPVYLYEKAASRPERENLANIRKGEFEGLEQKLRDPEWRPDFGPQCKHPTAGASVIGARMPLVAFNINLDTSDITIADKIARCIRHISGGLRYVKAIGVRLEDRGIVQVSINMTDYTKTPLYQAFELVKIEAKRYGVNVTGSEIIGLTPMEALTQTAAYYLGLEKFSSEQILERRMME